MLVRRVLVDNEAESPRYDIYRYEWLKRFAESGLEGLKNLPRTGRPPEVLEERFTKIKRELSKNPAGWKAKEIMNIIYERTGIRYHEVHIYRLLHKWKFSPEVPRKRFVNSASNEEKKQHMEYSFFLKQSKYT